MPDALTPPLGDDDHVDGPPDAPLELVMYGDFQCPYCSAAQPIVRRVRERLGDRLRYAFRHLPITAAHPDAQRAALGVQFARRRGPPRRHQQRRDEHEQDHVAVELDLRHARDEGQRETREHEHDRVGDAQPIGRPHEQHRGEQQSEEELEVAHGRVSLGSRRFA